MAELFSVEPQTSTSSSGRSMPGKGARSTALIQAKMVALAPIPSAKVTTTVRVKPGRFNSVRRLYRKSCQKVSIRTLDGPDDPTSRRGCFPAWRELHLGHQRS